MGESLRQKKIFNAMNGRKDARLFRNNCGLAYMGSIVNKTRRQITIQDYRGVVFGLQSGSSDLIGITKIKITPDMVGKEIGAFTSIEVKKKGKKASERQENWISFVNNFGGIGGVARTPGDANAIIEIGKIRLQKGEPI